MAFQLNKILISEPVDSSCQDLLQNQGLNVVTKIGLSKEELKKEIETYDALVVRSATKVTADVIEAGKQLQVIGRAGVGVDNIDCNAATKNGVVVLNAPAGNTLSAAELTCGMISSLSREISRASSSVKSGKWERKNFMGNELYGKTLAIVGLGRIGREVASRMQAFGMKTIGFDPLVPADVSITFGVESFELEQIWPQADYITLHVPLIPQTKNLINKEVLYKCKKGVRIVNCARGGIIDESALLEALESGQCGGAGLDVYAEEPPPKDLPLLQHPGVICTPHLGASTKEAQNRVAQEIAEQFIDLINGKSVLGIVNSPAFCASLATENRPWVSLCQSLGAILASQVSGSASESKLSISLGSEISGKRKVLEIATLVGFLKQLKYKEANFVNASLLAKEAKIEVTAGDIQSTGETVLPNSVVVTVSAGSQCHNVTGTVNGNDPLLVSINGLGFENPAKLFRNVLLCHGEYGKQMTVDLLGTLVGNGAIHSAHWSAVSENRIWCIINGDNINESVPNNLRNVVDVWVQLAI